MEKVFSHNFLHKYCNCWHTAHSQYRIVSQQYLIQTMSENIRYTHLTKTLETFLKINIVCTHTLRIIRAVSPLNIQNKQTLPGNTGQYFGCWYKEDTYYSLTMCEKMANSLSVVERDTSTMLWRKPALPVHSVLLRLKEKSLH